MTSSTGARGSAAAALNGNLPWIVGVDGSDCAREALGWALAHAPGRASSLHLLTAWQTPVYASPSMAAPMTVPIDDTALADSARATTQAEADHARTSTSVPVEPVIAHGSASKALIEAGAEASLIVVGSRGRGGFGRLLLGSTSTQCATHAEIPTAVIPSDHAVTTTASIVVAIDGSENSLAALEWALTFAEPGSTVRVLWVWDATPLAVGADEFFFPDASDTAEERFHHLIDEVTESGQGADVTIERSFVHGRPRSVIAEAAADTDLLVIGARGHGAVGSAILGSVSTWLLHHVDCPVVVVPHPEETTESE
jgi:nucleotide-binding universal stress UspA family protein